MRTRCNARSARAKAIASGSAIRVDGIYWAQTKTTDRTSSSIPSFSSLPLRYLTLYLRTYISPSHHPQKQTNNNKIDRIWRWRNQYGEVLGGTGIGEGDRGVICGREAACLGAREVAEETDCDAADAREQEHQLSLQHHHYSSSPASTPSPSSSFTTSSPLSTSSGSASGSDYSHSLGNRTPSPPHYSQYSHSHSHSHSHPHAHSHSIGFAVSNCSAPILRPGYARHEIEGIGGVVKTKLVRMMRVGACVPEWEDERNGGSGGGRILEREVSGRKRSFCGWCWRVIPGAKDKGPLLY